MNCPAPVVAIEDIDWSERVYRGRGAFSVVYRVAPNIAAKLGGVGQYGVNAQRQFNSYGLALPVLASGHTYVPDYVAQELCNKHGYAKDLGVHAEATCSCHIKYVSILLTPEAQDLSVEERRSKEYRNFRRKLRYRCKKLGYLWDFDNPDNIMCYQDKLVAIDFS